MYAVVQVDCVIASAPFVSSTKEQVFNAYEYKRDNARCNAKKPQKQKVISRVEINDIG